MSVALLFSPQGSQHVGMGRELAGAVSSARAVYDAADEAVGWPVSDTCWNGPEERLNDTRWTQPCLLATSLAAFAALEGLVDPHSAVVAGHSVGEYAALVVARVISLEDGLRLVARRGALMAEASGSGGMAAVLGLDRSAIEAVLAQHARPTELVVANDNAPGQVVVSGDLDAIERLEPLLLGAGAKRVVRLRVSGAFHSPRMAGVAGALARAFEQMEWRDAAVPVVSNVTAEPLTDAARIRALLAEQVRSPVEWVRCVQRMVDDGVDTFVECGPGGALAGMVRRIAPAVRTLTVSDRASLDATAAALRGAPLGTPLPAGAS